MTSLIFISWTTQVHWNHLLTVEVWNCFPIIFSVEPKNGNQNKPFSQVLIPSFVQLAPVLCFCHSKLVPGSAKAQSFLSYTLSQRMHQNISQGCQPGRLPELERMKLLMRKITTTTLKAKLLPSFSELSKIYIYFSTEVLDTVSSVLTY